MFTLIETLFARLGGSAILTGIGVLVNKYRPIKITGQKAPRNFFDHFGPGSAKEFVKSKIGPPHRQSGAFWFYRFSDALAQFDFSGGESARSVALALTVESPSSGFDLPMIGIPLGKLTLDHFTGYSDGKLTYRSSLRTWELLYSVSFPPHWASNYCTFGALSLLAPFSFKEVSFDTQLAQHSPNLAAKGTLVNWVGISDTSEEIWFDWSIAVPASA